MFRHLLESAPNRQRARSAAALSFVFHLALVGLALAATAIDPRTAAATEEPIIDIIFPAPRPRSAAPAPSAPRPPSPPVRGQVPPVIMPVEAPSTLPPIPEPGTPPMDPWTTLPAMPGVPGVVGGTDDQMAPGDAGDGGPMWPEDVARAAKPIGAMREPRYPDPLRTSRLEGTVIATYVVDTLGRVEPASFKSRDATHPLFEQAVRTAVMQQRFRAAEWNGRRVRQLVEQQFVFRLNR